nr:acetyl-CoA hydrolase/transferase C-terminal domain-containing protein [Mesorhizobium sp.]
MACAASGIPGLFETGERVFVPGSASAPVDILKWLEEVPERSAGLELTTTLIAGINRFDVARLHPTARTAGNFMQSDFREPQRQGRFRYLPITYAGFVRYVREIYQPDAAIAVVSPPNAAGEVSLGLSVEMTALCLARARRTIAVVNSRMPFLARSERLPLSSFDVVLHSDTELPTYGGASQGGDAETIASHVASLVDDGAALQVGLGKVPDAILRAVLDRRRLRIHSGIVSDGVIGLAQAGALDSGFPHAVCGIVGTRRLYDWAESQDLIRVQGCDQTHDPARIAGIDGFIAINSALTVDLFGQCDLETAAGRTVSSFGGAPDFARGARNSRGGLSIVALPATYLSPAGVASRVVPRLGPENMVSIARYDVDVVATEYGLADLRGRSVYERAEALIDVAAPEFRAELRDRWAEILERI